MISFKIKMSQNISEDLQPSPQFSRISSHKEDNDTPSGFRQLNHSLAQKLTIGDVQEGDDYFNVSIVAEVPQSPFNIHFDSDHKQTRGKTMHYKRDKIQQNTLALPEKKEKKRRNSMFCNSQHKTTQQKLRDIPIDQDTQFLEAIRDEMLAFQQRIRQEVLQKLELLKQIKVLKSRLQQHESPKKKRNLMIDQEVQCDIEQSERADQSFNVDNAIDQNNFHQHETSPFNIDANLRVNQEVEYQDLMPIQSKVSNLGSVTNSYDFSKIQPKKVNLEIDTEMSPAEDEIPPPDSLSRSQKIDLVNNIRNSEKYNFESKKHNPVSHSSDNPFGSVKPRFNLQLDSINSVQSRPSLTRQPSQDILDDRELDDIINSARHKNSKTVRTTRNNNKKGVSFFEEDKLESELLLPSRSPGHKRQSSYNPLSFNLHQQPAEKKALKPAIRHQKTASHMPDTGFTRISQAPQHRRLKTGQPWTSRVVSSKVMVNGPSDLSSYKPLSFTPNEAQHMNNFAYSFYVQRQAEIWEHKYHKYKGEKVKWQKERTRIWTENKQLQLEVRDMKERVNELEMVIQQFNLNAVAMPVTFSQGSDDSDTSTINRPGSPAHNQSIFEMMNRSESVDMRAHDFSKRKRHVSSNLMIEVNESEPLRHHSPLKPDTGTDGGGGNPINNQSLLIDTEGQSQLEEFRTDTPKSEVPKDKNKKRGLFSKMLKALF